MLEARVRALSTEHRDVRRGRIVLLAAGRSARSLADVIGVIPNTVSTWRWRDAREGLAGRGGKLCPGQRRKDGFETSRRIPAVLERPPAGFACWTGPLIAAELSDVHEQQVWRLLRKRWIALDGGTSWCEGNDANFAAKAAGVVRVNLVPLENAVNICVDEKPSIQAIERAQGYLKLPNSWALIGRSHDYRQHGSITLFGRLEVATGKLTANRKRRHGRVELLDFMNEIVALYSDKDIHVAIRTRIFMSPWIRLNTPTTPRPTVGMTAISTFASSSRQPGVLARSGRDSVLSILAGKSLRGGSFTSVAQLQHHVDEFIEAYNATPDVWTNPQVYRRHVKRPWYQPIVIPGCS